MKNKKNLLIITIIFAIFSIIFYAKTGNMLIDFSRESYIPFEINNNANLIKDIFLIYGPFGYIINSFLYKINFNINSILILAHLISYFCAILFYLITKKFSNNNISLIFTIFFIIISIFSNSTFSFVVPYSYSTLWAIFGIYTALYSLLYDKNKLLFLSLGLILSNKIELFIPVFLISLLYLIYKKTFSIKNFLYIVVIPIISFSFIFINTVSFEEILNNMFYLKQMTSTNAIKYLYQGMGTFFEIKYFLYNIANLIKLFIIFSISYIFYKKNKKLLSYIILTILLFLINIIFALNLILLIILPIAIYLYFKNKIKVEELLLFIFAAILCSKSIFAINSLSYSNFGYLPLIFVLYLLTSKILDEKWIKNSIIIFMLLTFTGNLTYYFINPKQKIKTQIGNIYIDKKDYNIFKKTNEYIEKNIKNDENFIVIPEGQIFNLIHKKQYKFYNSTFTPLDFETFGEKYLINELINKKTDYIIFFPRDTQDYGKKTICQNYGVDFCSYIKDNYIKTVEINDINDINNVNIYKIKKK